MWYVPTLSRYQDQPGYYIRGTVDNSVVTFQTTPRARKLFDEMGYQDGSTIPWRMIKQLQEKNVIYTGKSGTSVEVVDDKELDLGPDKSQIYQMFLQEGRIDSGKLERLQRAVSKVYDDNTYSSRVQDTTDKLLQADLDKSIEILESFTSVPYTTDSIEIIEDRICCKFTVAEGVQFICKDLRGESDPPDFQCIVSYDNTKGTTAQCEISEGYIVNWTMDDGQECNSAEFESMHKAAFKADFGLKSGLGFNESNWTEVVRRFFLFVPNYDIHPAMQGHRGLSNQQELEGQHIWIDAHKTDSSSSKGGPGQFVVTNEIVTIKLPKLQQPGEVLVELGDIRKGETIAEQVSLRTSH